MDTPAAGELASLARGHRHRRRAPGPGQRLLGRRRPASGNNIHEVARSVAPGTRMVWGDMNPVRWGLLSTAGIARLMVEAARRSEITRFVAVASRDGDRARQFAADFDLEQAFASYQALLDSDRVDAVYVWAATA